MTINDTISYEEMNLSADDNLRMIASDIQGRKFDDVKIVCRLKRLMRNNSEIIKSHKKIKTHFPDAYIVREEVDDEYIYIYISVPELSYGSIRNFRQGNWILFSTCSEKNIFFTKDSLRKLFTESDIHDKLSVILEQVEMCGRIWPWENEEVFQFFAKPSPLT